MNFYQLSRPGPLSESDWAAPPPKAPESALATVLTTAIVVLGVAASAFLAGSLVLKLVELLS